MNNRICVKAGKAENGHKIKGGQAVGVTVKVTSQKQRNEEAATDASSTLLMSLPLPLCITSVLSLHCCDWLYLCP